MQQQSKIRHAQSQHLAWLLPLVALLAVLLLGACGGGDEPEQQVTAPPPGLKQGLPGPADGAAAGGARPPGG